MKHKLAVVTGGASGIGLGVARALLEQETPVVIGDVGREQLDEVGAIPGVTAVPCDVTSEDGVAALAKSAEAIGHVDFVMANAGVAAGGRFESIPQTEWHRLFEVNVHGVVRTINAFLPGMLERGQGTIVITGSSAGLFNSDGFNAPYTASKHAVLGVAKALSAYTADKGLSVHYLAPRLTDTAFPRSAVAWGRRGRSVMTDRDIGTDFDTVDDVVAALLAGIEEDRFVISLTPGTEERLTRFAQTLASDF